MACMSVCLYGRVIEVNTFFFCSHKHTKLCVMEAKKALRGICDFFPIFSHHSVYESEKAIINSRFVHNSINLILLCSTFFASRIRCFSNLHWNRTRHTKWILRSNELFKNSHFEWGKFCALFPHFNHFHFVASVKLCVDFTFIMQ